MILFLCSIGYAMLLRIWDPDSLTLNIRSKHSPGSDSSLLKMNGFPLKQNIS